MIDKPRPFELKSTSLPCRVAGTPLKDSLRRKTYRLTFILSSDPVLCRQNLFPLRRSVLYFKLGGEASFPLALRGSSLVSRFVALESTATGLG